MPETEVPVVVVILLASCVGLLLLMLLLMFRLSTKLTRMESLVSEIINRESKVETGPSAAETSAGGAFEAFLSEDPSRRELTKSEQFSAYRQWRQEKGMNWSNS